MLRRRLGLGLLIGGLMVRTAPALASVGGETDLRRVVAIVTENADCRGLAGKFPRYTLKKTTLPTLNPD